MKITNYKGEYIILFNIKHLRSNKNYTQQYLANHLNTSQALYSKIERGIAPLTVERLLLIAELLDVNVAYLFAKKLYRVEN